MIRDLLCEWGLMTKVINKLRGTITDTHDSVVVCFNQGDDDEIIAEFDFSEFVRREIPVIAGTNIEMTIYERGKWIRTEVKEIK